MKKTFLFSIIMFVFSLITNAQKLVFNENGTFKIAQFTDMHYVHGNPKSDTTLLILKRILDAEKPDLIVFTGDIVTTKEVKKGWDTITKFAIDRQIPFAVTFGNHDDEQGVSRSELAYLITQYPYNVNKVLEDGLLASLNNVVPVYGSKKNMQVKSAIYLIDSNAYSTISGVGGYGWITTDVIEWYKKQSIRLTINNNLQPVPSVAFFHIPLPEYRTAFNDEKNVRYGVRLEKECAPELNSGMFLAMKEMRDVMGVFTGHDHVNDYIVDYYDIALAYGCFSGWKTTYTPETNGSRIIELKEGEREFNTWIHLLDGTIKERVSYPQDFKKEE
ncbi:MAG: metallophosphoesterase family protein [Dysgonamonadaceae bacterium]